MAVKKVVTLLAIVVSIALGIIALRAVWWEVFEVPTESMVPTFAVGDLLLVNKLAFGGPTSEEKDVPVRGEIIVFHQPQTNTLYVKRVIGLPGDEVMILGGTIWVNGTQIEHTTNQTAMVGWGSQWDQSQTEQRQLSNGTSYRTVSSINKSVGWKLSGYWTVPAGHVFVVGDWRDHSSDSREWGAVPLGNVVGRVVCSWGKQSKGCNF